MNGLLIVGSTIACAGAGAIIGSLYGFAVDKSDFPIYPAFTIPVGALLGGLVGVIAGSAVFA